MPELSSSSVSFVSHGAVGWNEVSNGKEPPREAPGGRRAAVAWPCPREGTAEGGRTEENLSALWRSGSTGHGANGLFILYKQRN